MKKLLLIALLTVTAQAEAMFVRAARLVRPAVRTLATKAPQKPVPNDTVKAMIAGGIATWVYLCKKPIKLFKPRS